MSQNIDIVVVGAGVIGTVAATLLIHRGVARSGRIALIADRLPAAGAPGADWDLRVFALSRASERILRLCGVWERLAPDRLCAYERMCVWDESGSAQGSGSLSFDCAEIGEPDLGSIVEGRALQAQCLQAARAAGVILIESGIGSVTMADADVRIRVTDGRELRAQLILAADGVESKTRGLLGIESAGHSYHQDALVAHVRTAKPHQRTAWQRFLRTGPLALLPLPDGRCSIVWSTATPTAARLAALDPDAFGAELTEASAGVLGRCELTTPIARFPLRLQYASHYVCPRAALLGDAAHAVHPLAGQGLNLGLLDAAALAEVLGEATGSASPGDLRLLRRYERWRKSENLLAATAMDSLERLFTNSNSAVQGLRSAGLSLVGRLPALKRQFARQALGLAGDVPSFLRKSGPASPRR
ncbi:MAG: FAD-dependent monooxygenase [Steroidobacterales bacterium]